MASCGAIEGHRIDKARGPAAISGKVCKIVDLVIVYPGYHHRVELHHETLVVGPELVPAPGTGSTSLDVQTTIPPDTRQYVGSVKI